MNEARKVVERVIGTATPTRVSRLSVDDVLATPAPYGLSGLYSGELPQPRLAEYAAYAVPQRVRRLAAIREFLASILLPARSYK